ncbi:MAG: hypothetical protein IJV67_04265, partial [Clostridia bacterium]|nr:hypothetical protein [Clostridia bacterium]
ARRFSAYSEGSRSVLEIDATDDFADFIRAEIEDRIADIIAVNYKYACFSSSVHPYGLTDGEREILLSALIAADIDDDKHYIKRKIASETEYSVDGLFNFRLAPLKRKWAEVVSFIPKTFNCERLKDFIAFLLEEKRGYRVFVENGKVFDKHFRRLNRAFLTGRQYGDDKLLNELLLSGCGEVELLSSVTDREDELLKEYFGSKVVFGKTYFC